eukprot:s4539_g1.t1
MLKQLKREWFVIWHARGFGSRWSAWLLSFEDVPFVPASIPDHASLDLFVDITEMYAKLVCSQEATSRYQHFRHRLRVDQEDGFSSLTYKIVKGSSSPPLCEVPYEISSKATLVRATKGSQALKLTTVKSFVMGKDAMFGDHTIQLVSQSNDKIFFQSETGGLPCTGILTQKNIAMTTQEIQSAFNEFWNVYWNRDSSEELSDPMCQSDPLSSGS